MPDSKIRIYQFPGGLSLQRDGAWIQGGAPVTHERIISYLNRSLAWSDEAGAWGIPSGEWFIPVEIEDTPFLITAADLDSEPPTVEVSNETVQPFRAETLRFGSDDAPYVEITCPSAPNASVEARFTRAAMQSLIPRIGSSPAGYTLTLGAGARSKTVSIGSRTGG